MHPSSLVFLESSTAKKLAAAWPYLSPKERDDPEAWSRLAGVRKSQAVGVGRPLRASGICKDDGTTDELALKFIATTMTAKMPKKK